MRVRLLGVVTVRRVLRLAVLVHARRASLHELAGDLARQQEVGETMTSLEGVVDLDPVSRAPPERRETQPGIQVLGGSQRVSLITRSVK